MIIIIIIITTIVDIKLFLQFIQLETYFLETTFELLWDREQTTKTEL